MVEAAAPAARIANQVVVVANQAAIAEIARLVELDSIECAFEHKAHIVYTTDASRAESVTEEAEVAARLGLPASSEQATDLPFEVAAAVRFDDQAQFHPRAYCLGLAAAVTAAGGRVHAHTRARHIDGEERVVVTDRGELRGDAIVVATHLPPKEMGAYFARTEPLRSYALAVTVDGSCPNDMYLSAEEPTRSLRTAGDHLIVGGESHKVGEAHDTTEHYRNLERWAREHFSVTGVEYRWSAQDWKAADGLAYIGRMPGHDDGVYVATAFKKWGMTHGTVAAMIIRDLVTGRDNPWLEVYDSTRIAPKQSLKGVVSENISVLKHFIETLELRDLVHDTVVPDVRAVWAAAPGGITARLHVLARDPPCARRRSKTRCLRQVQLAIVGDVVEILPHRPSPDRRGQDAANSAAIS